MKICLSAVTPVKHKQHPAVKALIKWAEGIETKATHIQRTDPQEAKEYLEDASKARDLATEINSHLAKIESIKDGLEAAQKDLADKYLSKVTRFTTWA